MRKTLFVATLAILAQLMGACQYIPEPQPLPDYPDYEITYTFTAMDQLTQQAVNAPISMSVTIPGFAVWTTVSPTIPATVTIPAKQYPPAERNSSVIGTMSGNGGPVGTLLTCTWSAQTPAGVRVSADSVGGEGAGTGRYASATCTYKA
jgi:hypothetical protein